MDNKKYLNELCYVSGSRILREQSESSLKAKIKKWFIDNPYPKDTEFHKFAEDTLKMEPDKAETIAYAILSDYLKIGKHQKDSATKYDHKQIKMGIGVEKEHTDNPEIAVEIAKDHLSEISDYYTRLKKMEDEAKGKD